MELSVDEKGNPVISFKHSNKNNLEQKLLKVFIDKAIKNGIYLERKKQFIGMGSVESWDEYEICTQE